MTEIKTSEQSWGLARELRRDHFSDWDEDHSTLSYHRWRFELPLFVIRDIIGDAQQDGIAPAKIKILFDSTCYETNAAVFDGLAQNPGGLFRSCFSPTLPKGNRTNSKRCTAARIAKNPARALPRSIRPIKSVESVKTAT